MQAIDLLLKRNSRALLTDPAPKKDELATIIQAGMRAPDHGQLKPWRFIAIQGQARQALGELMLKASLNTKPDLPEEKQLKILSKPFRAPLIIVVVTSFKKHPIDPDKIPLIEQQLSAACAAHGIVLAAEALGYGAIWRTGSLSFDPLVELGLGLTGEEEIAGFIYIGSPKGSAKRLPELAVDDFLSSWG